MTAAGVPPRVAYALICLLAVGVPACERDEQHTAQPPAAQPPIESTQAVRGSAKISGHVRFEGAPPRPQFVPMGADPFCARANEGSGERVPVRVAADGGLADVFVYVSEGIGAGYAVPAEPIVLDQRACAYAPRVLGLQVGQPLDIRNSDETLHNVHALAQRGAGFNIGMPHKGMSSVRKFTAPEVLVRVKCDVHPWMDAYVGVTAHPFFSVTSEDGSYELTGLPAGSYAISAVHYDLGGQVERVTVDEGAAISADFRFSD